MSMLAMIGLIYVGGLMFTACLLSFLAMASKSISEKTKDDKTRGSFIVAGAVLWPFRRPARASGLAGTPRDER